MSLTNKPRTGLRAAAALAVAAVVSSLGTPVAAAAPPASTSISIRVADQKIEAGESTNVLGNLNVKGPASEANREVTLEAKAQGETEFVPVEVTTTGPQGGLRLEVAPTTTTRYRWHFAGAADDRVRLLVQRRNQAPAVVAEGFLGADGSVQFEVTQAKRRAKYVVVLDKTPSHTRSHAGILVTKPSSERTGSS